MKEAWARSILPGISPSDAPPLKVVANTVDPHSRDRLLREAEAGARLQHPAIAIFYESSEADGEAFIAMECPIAVGTRGDSMILIVGSTGAVGQNVALKLVARGKRVRALVRPGAGREKRQRLEAAGISVASGDLKDSASLHAACEGATTVVSTASATISRGDGDTIASVDRDGQLQLLKASRQAGVRHFIYLSFSGNMRMPSPLHDAKRAVERRLQESGMAYTIVRPSIFMDVWLSPHAGFDPLGGKVRIYGSGDQPVSMISASDVAEYVAACVDNPAVMNQVIELGGPEAVSYNTVTSLFERALGRTIEKVYIPEAALEQQLATAHDPLQMTLTALAIGVARGDVIDNAAALDKARIPLTPVRDYVARVVGSAPPQAG